MKVKSLAVAGALAFCASGTEAQTFQKEVMCAAQAERVYKKDQANFAPSADINITGYEDHYNQKMDRCFMLEHTIITGSGSAEVVTTLIDAFAGRVLARYSSDNGVEDCELTPDYVTTRCKSGPEFDAFVEQYIGKVGGGVRHY
jgi:hypothetical protein